VESSFDQTVELTISVAHRGSVIYRTAHSIPPGADTTVAGITRTTLPEGERSLTITGTDERSQTTSVNVTVTECLGNVRFLYTDTGGLESTYSIC
jgi:hypothetical protein